jgi:hypothetical protein
MSRQGSRIYGITAIARFGERTPEAATPSPAVAALPGERRSLRYRLTIS